MDTLLLTVLLAVGLHCSTVRSLDSRLDTNNAAVQQAICNKHNELRKIVIPTASNMQTITWSKEAAETARKVAEKCIYAHSTDQERTITTGILGENLARAAGVLLLWNDCIQLWFNEFQNFTYGSGATPAGATFLHYTQVASATTVLVGCAIKECPGFLLHVCHYGPRGNVGPYVNKPYEEGPPCGKCPNNCVDKLCTNGCLYGNDDPVNCPSYKQWCSSMPQVASGCQATCNCG